MDPVTIAALSQLGIGAAQTFAGMIQKVPERPQYNNASLDEMKRLSAQQMNSSISPEMAAGKQMVDSNTSSSAYRLENSIRSSGDLLNGISAIAQGGNRSLSDMIRHNMALKNQRRSQHLNVLSQAAQDERYAFQQNDYQKYMDAAQTRSSLFGGGLRTMTDAGSQYAAIAQMQAGQPKEKNTINLPSSPNRLGYMEMANGGQSWGDIIASLNR